MGLSVPPPSLRYRCADLLLSPGRRLLLRDGRPVPLPPRYLDLLLLLIAERHRVVTRDEIHRLVWGGVAVTDGAFTQAVRTLRRALDDDAREPRFIRTASRHGYQFVGTGVVEEDDTGPLAGVATGVDPAAPPAAPELGLERRFSAVGGELLAPIASSATALAGLVGGALGGGAAGVAAAVLLGPLLVLAGGAGWRAMPVLACIGAAVGFAGGGPVGAGVALGATRRRWRVAASIALGATGGGIVGAGGHLLVGWAMSELLGKTVTALGGALEGIVLGGAVALGAAAAGAGELALRRRRGAVTLAAALCGAIAAGVLALSGAHLSGSSLDAIAGALRGSRVVAPLGELLGERGGGPTTRLVVSLFEGGLFGAGVAAGVTRALRRGISAARTGAAPPAP